MQSQMCARIENSLAWIMRVRYGLNRACARIERCHKSVHKMMERNLNRACARIERSNGVSESE